MLLEQALAPYAPGRPSICTVGVFDGVHLGHQALVRRTVDEAAARSAASGVVVLHPHPREVLVPGAQVPLLTPLEDRMALLRRVGVDFVAPVQFTVSLSQLTAREFMAVLVKALRLTGLVAGPDFAVGKGREGSVEALGRLGHELGYEMMVIGQLEEHEHKVSSSTIRSAIAVGDVSTAARLLGRNFSTKGRVAHGAARGRTLGYPTANITVDARLALPADGIYATRARAGGRVLPSATYVGNQPTFDGQERTIEVFLLDFDGDIYGEELEVEWVSKVRDDHRFESVDALVSQMAADVDKARSLLGVG